MVKNLPANVGDAGDGGLIPGSGRSPGEGNGNPLQWTEEAGGLQSMRSQSWTRLSTVQGCGAASLSGLGAESLTCVLSTRDVAEVSQYWTALDTSPESCTGNRDLIGGGEHNIRVTRPQVQARDGQRHRRRTVAVWREGRGCRRGCPQDGAASIPSSENKHCSDPSLGPAS